MTRPGSVARQGAEAPALPSAKTFAASPPRESERARLVAVLSLSRSGSSLVARILQEALQIDFGETIEHIPANRNNPDGYYENAEILRLNEDVLSAAGASVFRPPPLDYFTNPGGLESLVDRARRLLEYYSVNRRSFGFKDPRLSLTFPVWKLAAPGIVPVIVFRDPGAAALSIADQNGISVEHATGLWFEYYSRIFHYTSGLERYVVSFERLLADTATTVAGLASQLGVAQDGIADRVRGLVDLKRVRHAAGEPPAYSPYIDPETKLLYAYLKSVVDDGAQPDHRHLGSLIAGLEQFRHLAELRRGEERQRERSALETASRTKLAAQQAEHKEQLEAARQTTLAAQQAEHREQLEAARLEHQAAAAVLEARHREELLQSALRHQADKDALERKHRVELDAVRLKHREVNWDERQREQLVQAAQHQQRAALERCLREEAERSEERYRLELEGERSRHQEALAALEDRQREQLAGLEQQLAAAQAQLREACAARDVHQAESARKDGEIAAAGARLLDLRARAAAMLGQLEAFRGRRSVRWLSRWLGRDDVWGLLTPAFQRLKDDSLLFNGRLPGHRLTPSPDFRDVECLTYPLSPRRPGLSAVLLAVIQDLPQNDGYIGVELVSPGGQIVAQSTLPLSAIDPSRPVTLPFAPLADTHSGRFWLRVFARLCPQPVRILEWRRWGFGGLGPRGVRPFCGLRFDG